MPLHIVFFMILCPATCAYAFARGGAPERILACAILLAFVLTLLFQTSQITLFRILEWKVWVIDVALLGAILIVALFSTRFWPVLMATLQATSTLAHFAKALDATIWPVVYIALANMISWPIIMLLIAATMRHQRRLRRYGVDFAWVWQLPAAYRAGWIVDERRPAPGAEDQ